MRAADGYVMSSAWEGLANVLLEASCAELPVVATDVGGNREVVRDGTSGILVPPHHPGKLAAAMRQVMRMSPAGRQAMGRAGRAGVVERYSIEKITGRWEEIYAGLLGGIPETAERLRSWT
jgi:glycosyltransferase involved in cell wall biosynthesis